MLEQDGYGVNSTEVLTIRILDVQDTPPIFLGTPYVVTVTENIPVVSFCTFLARLFSGKTRGIAMALASSSRAKILTFCNITYY